MARSRFVWIALPAVAVIPTCATALTFHITIIAEVRGWSPALLAAAYPMIAVANVVSVFVSGQVIDRLSARKLFLVQSVPLIVGFLVLAAFTGPWALFVAFACLGLSGGVWRPTATAMWAELFGTDVLGTIRSAITMYMVLATAMGPFVFGAALEAGWSVSQTLTVFAVGSLLAMMPPMFAERRALV